MTNTWSPPATHSASSNQETFSDLIQHIDEVIFWRKPGAPKPAYVSPAFERVWGRPCSSVYAEPSSWIESIHVDDCERVLGRWSTVEDPQGEYDYRIVRPDGHIRWVSVRTFAVRDAAGRTEKIVGIAKDCTEQRRSENARAFLAAIVDSSRDSIVGTDLNSRILSWNKASEELFGFTAEEALGQHIGILFAPERQGDYVQSLERIRHIERTHSFESVRVTKGGVPVDVLVILSPVKDSSGELQGVSAIYHDITSRKLADAQLLKAKEAAEAAARAKSEFLANMSHEIRTPMNGILGMTELALDTELDATQREYLNAVKYSADSLLAVINDILDFSKIEVGKLGLDPIEFNFRDHLGQAMKALAVRAHEKDIELACFVPPEFPNSVVGDPVRLRQVILNLVGNAIKFTEKGEVVLRAEIVAEDESNLTLHYSVRDTGIGIPPEKQKLIFEPFSQADASTTRKYGGTGLGLTISMRLIEMMGGRLWLESETGKGSTFHFTTQLGRATGVVPGSPHIDMALLRNLPVLVVDDNETNRQILDVTLHHWSMKPVCVSSAHEALLVLNSARELGKPFALMLVDCHMPEVDGFMLVEEIRQQPEFNSLAVLMLTSGGQRGDGARCKELGISAYLIKPVLQSDLLETLVRVLSPAGALGAMRTPPITRHTLREGRRSLHILLAEDNSVNQRLASRLLEKQGHSVVVAGDGAKVLDALEKESFDLILMDVQMPVMDGVEATAEIRRRESVTGTHTPIIAMTAHAMAGDRQRFLAHGMDGYVSKPIHSRELFEAIEAAGAASAA